MVALSDPVNPWARLRERSNEAEWLDDVAVEPALLERNLLELERLNRLLGGHRSLLRVFKRALNFVPQRPLRLVDIGCGGGDGLRRIDDWCSSRGIKAEFVGLDLNPTVLETARSLSKHHPRIRFVQADAFDGTLAALSPDITTATLFCHHIPEASLSTRLATLLQASRAVVISDLHRHAIAHAGFRALARAARLSAMTRHDGAVSIRRGFKRHELEQLVAAQTASHTSIEWAFAFRYEVLLVR